MKIQIFITVLILIIGLKAQWLQRNNGLNLEGGLSGTIEEINGTEAVLGLSGAIYKTVNAGLSWEEVVSPPQFIYYEGRLAESIIDISVIDLNHIWISTEFTTPLGKGARIFASADGGQSWVKQFDDPSKTDFFNYIEMFDDQNGIAMGDVPFLSSDKSALILKTTDGGANWVQMNHNNLIGVFSGDTWRRIDFVSPNLGYFFASGINPQKIYKTLNGGTDWVETGSNFYAAVLNFYDGSLGIAANSYGDIFRTTDGSNTWTEISMDYENWPDDFEFSPKDPSKIWFLNSGKLFFSQDTGNTWTELFVTENMIGIDIEVMEDNSGWLLTKSGVYYSTNALTIFTSVKDATNPINFELYQNYPNPFNPDTRIKFTIPDVKTGHAPSLQTQLFVYDLLGNKIATLINSELEPGTYEVEFDGSNLSSGIYFYSLIYGSNVLTKKMTILK